METYTTGFRAYLPQAVKQGEWVKFNVTRISEPQPSAPKKEVGLDLRGDLGLVVPKCRCPLVNAISYPHMNVLQQLHLLALKSPF